MKDASRTVQAIQGTITMMDGTTSEFIIGTDFGWQQWAAVQERLGRSVDTIEALVSGLQEAEISFASDNDEDGEYDDSPAEYTHRGGDPLNIDLGDVLDIDGEARVYLPHFHLGKTWCETYDPASGIGVVDAYPLSEFDFIATGESVDPTRYLVELYAGGEFVAEVQSFLSLASAQVWAEDMRSSTLGYVLALPGVTAVNEHAAESIIDEAHVRSYTSAYGSPVDSTTIYTPENSI